MSDSLCIDRNTSALKRQRDAMSEQTDNVTYQIVVKGVLDASWSEWFGNLDMAVTEDGCTVLTGQLADQAALRGILTAIWDLNLIVIAVNRVEQNPD